MFTRDTLKAFRVDFASTVIGLEKKYGIKLELGTIGYGDIDFHSKMTGTYVNSTGEKKVDTSNFNMLKTILGFNGNIGDKYVSNNIVYTITGLDGKKPKYPVLYVSADGKRYKQTVESANRYLKLSGVG